MGDWLDEITARQQAEQAAYDAREAAARAQLDRDGMIAWERLKSILRGERPTREPGEVWYARQQALRRAMQRGMLPMVSPAPVPRPAGMLPVQMQGDFMGVRN